MPNRTVKFIGEADANTTAVFTFNGNEVFNGTVNETAEPGELFSFEIDQAVHGTVPSSLSVSGGNITMVTLSNNYTLTVEGDTTADDAAAQFDWIEDGSHNANSNITIDGVAYDKGDTSGINGAWHILVADGETATCDWSMFASPGYIPEE